MARSARLHKKLLSNSLLTVAEDTVTDSDTLNRLWSLKQGESILLSSQILNSQPLLKYRLEYNVVRGPIPGHWLYREFDAKELEIFFIAKNHENICRSWLIFHDEET
ncbi:hypothetical protein GCM10009304_09040 [Pseudomonas matsuisoli]|uniref:Uncharacterized protein n=1 Tax=Pseudomonas matsuisoli TaxID=1515666 RepID=A0A917PMS7_9PSED|nr:hypothetical protein GCM10009304_09040 [Pseudomonas matsuisoli]